MAKVLVIDGGNDYYMNVLNILKNDQTSKCMYFITTKIAPCPNRNGGALLWWNLAHSERIEGALKVQCGTSFRRGGRDSVTQSFDFSTLIYAVPCACCVQDRFPLNEPLLSTWFSEGRVLGVCMVRARMGTSSAFGTPHLDPAKIPSPSRLWWVLFGTYQVTFWKRGQGTFWKYSFH